MYLVSLKSSFMLGLLFLAHFSLTAMSFNGDSTTFYDIHQSGFEAIYLLQDEYQTKRNRINKELKWLGLKLDHVTSSDKKVGMLEEKLQLLEALSQIENAEAL